MIARSGSVAFGASACLIAAALADPAHVAGFVLVAALVFAASVVVLSHHRGTVIAVFDLCAVSPARVSETRPVVPLVGCLTVNRS